MVAFGLQTNHHNDFIR